MRKTPQEVFYEKQIEVFFEREYFHWITTKALKGLRGSRKVESELQVLENVGHLRFYFHRRNRYWRRKAAEIKRLVQQFSTPEFTAALGQQGELHIDAGLPTVGFHPRGMNVREFQGRVWTKTGHNLDRIFERDGIFYGTEIKNRLSYIERTEFDIKMRMCHELDLAPLFVARMMPKNYINDVFQAGGLVLIMKYQLYPLGFATLAKQVRERLQLPVDCPVRLQQGTLDRLLNAHQRKIARPSR